ncbi:MAG: substrate-binding domain-containing protein, partial [Armatimonadetes bacterium]|nr:substrate-binding domain-containing protein [Armatimonadota bacterium]
MRTVQVTWVALTLLCLFALLAATGCCCKNPPVATAAEGGSEPLIVVAPHVTQRSLDPITKEFAADRPGAKIDFKAAMVDEMVDTMEAEGGSGDVLVMMDGPEMRILESAGILDASRKRIWGTCPVVLVAPEGNPKKIQSIWDLTRSDIDKVAIPNPDRDSTG